MAGEMTVVLMPLWIWVILISNGVASVPKSFKRDSNNQNKEAAFNKRSLDYKQVNGGCDDDEFWHGLARKCIKCAEVCGSTSTEKKASCYEQSLFCAHNCAQVFFKSTRTGDCRSPDLFRYRGFDCCLNCSEFCAQFSRSHVTDCLKLCPTGPMSRVLGGCEVDEMYHPLNKTCVPCKLICAPGMSKIYCSRNCPNYTRHQQEEDLSGPCGLNEFYHPLNETCVPCGLICRSNSDNRSRNYCNQNCPGFNISNKGETETSKNTTHTRRKNESDETTTPPYVQDLSNISGTSDPAIARVAFKEDLIHVILWTLVGSIVVVLVIIIFALIIFGIKTYKRRKPQRNVRPFGAANAIRSDANEKVKGSEEANVSEKLLPRQPLQDDDIVNLSANIVNQTNMAANIVDQYTMGDEFVNQNNMSVDTGNQYNMAADTVNQTNMTTGTVSQSYEELPFPTPVSESNQSTKLKSF